MIPILGSLNTDSENHQFETVVFPVDVYTLSNPVYVHFETLQVGRIYWFPSHVIIFHHTSSYLFMFHHIPSYSIIFNQIQSYFIRFHHISSDAILFNHVSSCSLIVHISSYFIILHHIPSYSIIFRHTSSYSIIVHNMSPYFIIVHHILSCYIIDVRFHHISSYFIHVYSMSNYTGSPCEICTLRHNFRHRKSCTYETSCSDVQVIAHLLCAAGLLHNQVIMQHFAGHFLSLGEQRRDSWVDTGSTLCRHL